MYLAPLLLALAFHPAPLLDVTPMGDTTIVIPMTSELRESVLIDPPSSPILGVYDRFVDDLERAPGWVWLLLGLSALGLAAAIVGYAR